MFSGFKANKRYLNNYYITVITVLAVVNVVLFYSKPPSWDLLCYAPAFVMFAIPNIYLAILAWLYSVVVSVFRADFDLLYIMSIPIAMTITFTATAFLHNASHSSGKPLWLNRPLGEFMALWQLVGFPDWTIVHMMHHKHPDDPVLDPHPPMDKSYWKYLLELRQCVTVVFAKNYFELWGNNDESLKTLKELGWLSKIATGLKTVLWFLVLGSQLFTFFFAFSAVFKMLHFAWFNYATHVYTENGPVIVDLDQGFYKFINFVAFGLYFHKSHHIRAGLYNPSHLKDMP